VPEGPSRRGGLPSPEEEKLLRSTFLQAELATTAFQGLWVLLRLGTPSLPVCAMCLGAQGALQSTNLALAFLAPAGVYSWSLAAVMQGSTALLSLPLAQMGQSHTLRTCISPQRYRMLAFLAASAVTVCSLLEPSLASTCEAASPPLLL